MLNANNKIEGKDDQLSFNTTNKDKDHYPMSSRVDTSPDKPLDLKESSKKGSNLTERAS
jgi:hypothetical protein